jgi:importin subunit beta-1
MQVVCEATKAADLNVVAAAFESMVKIMALYYDFMAVYMQQALFAVRIINLIYYIYF